MARAIASGGIAILLIWDDSSFDVCICHGIREVGVDESGRNARHAQLIAGFQPQSLCDRAHGVLLCGIDRHGRPDLNPSGGNDVDEMSETLPAKNRKSGGDTEQNTFEVNVDHLLPIVDENVELAVSLTRQLDEVR